MITNATGLVLRTWPLTETSLIVHWLTSSAGRVATVAKGARRMTSPYRGKLDLFYLLDFSFSRSRRSELHTLREITLRETHPFLRQDLGLLQQASYCAALIERTTETDTPVDGLFDLMMGLLGHLPKQPAQAQTILAFELKLLNQLGLMPDLSRSHLKPAAQELTAALATQDWPALAQLDLTPIQRREVGGFLHGFLIYHIGKLARGRAEALGV